MLYGFNGQVQYYLYGQPADMRKGFDGLCGLVINHLKSNPQSGDVYIFINRVRTHIKLLVWDQGGFVIYYKRLEQGTFEMPLPVEGETALSISRQKLMLILEGISLKKVVRRKRFLA
jgi:transposase